MKKLLSLILSLLILTLSILSCAVPAAQEEATPTPTAQPTATPSPTPEPEPDYDNIVLPEPKSEKWESYGRIIFSLFRLQEVQEFMVAVDENGNEIRPKPVLGKLVCHHTIGETKDVFCGVYPFADDANGFFYTYTDLRPDDMVYVEIQIYNEAVNNEIAAVCRERKNALDELYTRKAQIYYDRLGSYKRKHQPDYFETEHAFWKDEDNNYFSCMTNNNCFFDKYIDDFYRDISIELNEKFDKKWEKKHGDLSAAQYYVELPKYEEFLSKVRYAFFKDEIEYYNEQGCDLYFDADTGIETDAITLRGFIPVKMITDGSFKCYDESAQYTLYFPTDFLTAYGVAEAEDIHCTEEDYEKYSNINYYREESAFYTRQEIEELSGNAQSAEQF